MKTIDYIAAAKRMAKAKSSLDFAKIIGLGNSTMSRYETKERVIDDFAAVKIAKILNINPLRVIIQANIEREKDLQKKAFWMLLREEIEDQAKRDKEPFSETL